MKNEIKKYLDKVTASIPDSEDARMVRLELEDHIMTKIELQMMSGVDEDSAIHQVLTAMGNEEVLQEELGEVHRQHKLRTKIIYETKKGQCEYLAKCLGKNLGVPYAHVADNPNIDDRELLIIIRKEKYGGMATPELGKYLQRMKKGKLQMVVFLYTVFPTGTKVNRNTATMGKDIKYIKKMLLNKGIEVIVERYCYRSLIGLGKILDDDVMEEARYFAKMMGIYV